MEEKAEEIEEKAEEIEEKAEELEEEGKNLDDESLSIEKMWRIIASNYGYDLEYLSCIWWIDCF